MPKLTPITASILAFGVLAASYVIYSCEEKKVELAKGSTLPLREPLSTIPLRFHGWVGHDTPLDDAVVRVARADDHIHRWYWSDTLGRGISLYVSYYGRPRTHLGHHPEACYPAVGWRLQARQELVLQAGGLAIPADMFYFERGTSVVTVVSFFSVGGVYTNDKDAARRAAHRAIDSERRNYLAQVQVSVAGRMDAARLADTMSQFFNHVVPQIKDCLPLAATAEARE